MRDLIHFYPEISSTIAESWQAAKYVDEVALDELSPMWADWDSSPYRHFYIKELAQCQNGHFVIPFKWIVYTDTVHCEAYSVIQEQVTDRVQIRVNLTDLNCLVRYIYGRRARGDSSTGCGALLECTGYCTEWSDYFLRYTYFFVLN